MVDRPSSTAMLVAMGIAAVHATPELRGLLPPGAGEMTTALLREESARSRATLALLRFRWFRRVVFGMQRFVTPGVFVHFALRKRFIDDAVRGALADGFEQVVVLGAGLDTLASRLHGEYPTVQLIEVDHPASQAAKLRLLPDAAKAGENLHFCALDLAQPALAAKLAECPGFQGDRRTVFLAEGLLMYLPEEAVAGLLTAITDSVRDGRIVFTALELSEADKPALRGSTEAVNWWLRGRDEPFRWGIRPSDMPAFLARFKIHLMDTAGEKLLCRLYVPAELGPLEIAAGEWIYVAEFRSRAKR